MSKQKFGTLPRKAIWEVHGKRCAYCEEHIFFRDLVIDHILPESLGGYEAQLATTLTHLGLPSDFDIRSYENLLPSCISCNRAKADRILPLGQLAILLDRARSRAARVCEQLESLKAEDKAEKLRIELAMGLERGAITIDDVAQILSKARSDLGFIRLTSPLIFLGDTPLLEISRSDVESLLDEKITLSRNEDEDLRLVHDDGREVRVRTLREYRAAIVQNFYPLTNAEIKIAMAYFEHALDTLDAIVRARVADVSYMDEPRVGVLSLELLPATLLFSPLDMADEEAFAEPLPRRDGLTVQNLVDRGEVRIAQVGPDLIALEAERMSAPSCSRSFAPTSTTTACKTCS